MYLVRKYDTCITGLISSDTKRSFLIAGTALAVLLLAIGALLAWIGAPPMNGRPWDAAILLDGAWRVANGQVPHRDFYSFVGSFPWYLAFVGMKLSHPCVSAIVYGDILLMAALCPTAMVVLYRRTSALYALLFTLFLGVLVVSPRPLGDPYYNIDYAMSYNRFGEALLGLFSVLVFMPPRSGDRQGLMGLVEAALMGLLLTLLWFVKLNYFAIGALFFGIGVTLRFLDLRSAVVCTLSALGFLGLFLALTAIPLSAMVGDFRIIAGAQDFRGKIEMLRLRGFENAWRLPVLLILTWEISSGEREVRSGWPNKWREWVLPLAVFGSALLLIASNTQLSELPLLAVAALYAAEEIRRQPVVPRDDSFQAARNLGALCVLLLFIVPTLGTDLKAMDHIRRSVRRRDFVSTETLGTTRLQDLRFTHGTRFLYSQVYMHQLDDGIQLLRRHADPGMRLMAPLFANPFHVALGLRPAEGGLSCWSWNIIDRRSHPPLARLIGDATHILLPTDQGSQFFHGQTPREVYGAEWDALGMETVEETTYYTLLKLRSPTDASSKH